MTNYRSAENTPSLRRVLRIPMDRLTLMLAVALSVLMISSLAQPAAASEGGQVTTQLIGDTEVTTEWVGEVPVDLRDEVNQLPINLPQEEIPAIATVTRYAHAFDLPEGGGTIVAVLEGVDHGAEQTSSLGLVTLDEEVRDEVGSGWIESSSQQAGPYEDCLRDGYNTCFQVAQIETFAALQVCTLIGLFLGVPGFVICFAVFTILISLKYSNCNNLVNPACLALKDVPAPVGGGGGSGCDQQNPCDPTPTVPCQIGGRVCTREATSASLNGGWLADFVNRMGVAEALEAALATTS